MGIEAAVLGAGKALLGSTAAKMAVGGAAASLAGSALDRRAQGKAANQANEVAAARTSAGLETLRPGFENAQNIRTQALGMGSQMRQQGMQQGLGMIGQLYGPTSGMEQQGNLAAQRMLLAGLPLQRAAILGGKIDYSQLQPQTINYDPNMLAGIFANARLPEGSINLPPLPYAQAMR
jgi:hypothetical protein